MLEELSISEVAVKKKLRRLSTVGSHDFEEAAGNCSGGLFLCQGYETDLQINVAQEQFVEATISSLQTTATGFWDEVSQAVTFGFGFEL